MIKTLLPFDVHSSWPTNMLFGSLCVTLFSDSANVCMLSFVCLLSYGHVFQFVRWNRPLTRNLIKNEKLFDVFNSIVKFK